MSDSAFYFSEFYGKWHSFLRSDKKEDLSLLLKDATKAASVFATLSLSQMVALCPDSEDRQTYYYGENAGSPVLEDPFKFQVWKAITCLVPEAKRKNVEELASQDEENRVSRR